MYPKMQYETNSGFLALYGKLVFLSLHSVKRIITILLSIAIYSHCMGQGHTMDSLQNVLKTEKEDTNKVNTLNALSVLLQYAKPDSAIIIAQQAYALATKLGWIKGNVLACKNIGVAYYDEGIFPKALDNDLKALKMAEELGNKQIQMMLMGNIGNVYDAQGDFAQALDYDLKTLQIAEEMGNKKMQGGIFGNIGSIYDEEGDYPKSLYFQLKALKIAEELGNKESQARCLGNIALVYDDQRDFSKAIDYNLKSLALIEQLGDKQLEASVLGNTGSVYQEQKNYPKALEYLTRAMKMAEEFGDKQLQASDLANIGTILQEQGNYPQALDNYLKAFKILKDGGDKQALALIIGDMGVYYTKTGKFKEAEEYLKRAIAMEDSIGIRNDESHAEENLSKLYDTTGRYQLALLYYKKATILKDTLFNMDKNKALTRKELTYQYEKKEALEHAEQEKKEAITEQEKKREKLIRNSFIAGFILMLALAFFIFRGYRQKQKANILITEQKEAVEQKNIIIEQQKSLVEHQKNLVEEKNKDILDSIMYAKRLQDAILPPLTLIRQYLPESFVLYKPKDIVAGDFYWMERAGDNILIAAADCTGHGVPGALVSVVCSNALNRTVKEFKITEPGKILDKVRELVLETFEKSEENVQDGMDISLCCINTKTKEAQWSGAYNSLWYIHNGEIKEVAADKQPIGKVDKPVPFNTHTINLQKGDTLYLFTDGYADQFGGPKGKKFKYKQLQELLLANASRSIDEQSNLLKDTLQDWKGELEQVDDVLVIGIRV